MTFTVRHNAKWREFGSPGELADALAKRIGDALGEAIALRGPATLAVSGGRTPRLLFEALSHLAIAWDKVTIVLVDERFVPPDDGRSNEKLVRTHLMQDRAASAKLLPLYAPEASVEEAAIKADAMVSVLRAPLDVVVLGMGPDGHTASFFPDAKGLDALYVNRDGGAVLPVHAPSAGEPRLTLSMQLLAGARLVVLHIESEERRTILTEALAKGELPIARVLSETASAPQIYWAD